MTKTSKVEKHSYRRDKKGVTKEEALRSLIDAGILDENGNHTEPCKNLGRAIKELKEKKPAE